MRKEALFAIFGGIVLGLVVAFGIWRTNNALKDKQAKQTNTENKVTSKQVASPEVQASTQLSSPLTIAKPSNLEVFTTDTLALSGLSSPNVKIVISNDNDDYIVTSDNQGYFEQNIDLYGGVNQLFVGIPNVHTTSLAIVYSSELEKQLTQGVLSASATAEQKAQEKINEVSLNIKAYIGTITDKSDLSLQMENEDGTIQLISIDENTTVLNEKSKKTISTSDLAIGDYVVALGTNVDSTQVKALRVIVSSPSESNNLTLIQGIVKENQRTSLTVQQTDQKELDISITNGAHIRTEVEGTTTRKQIRFVDIKEGETIIAVGTQDGNELEARTILRLLAQN